MRFTKTLSIAFTLGLLSGLSAAQAAGNGHTQAIEYRMSLMNVYKWNMGPMGKMLKGKIPYDAAAFTKYAQDLNSAVHLDLLSGFPEDSESPDSEARSDIWMDWKGFSVKYDDLKRATAALALTAPGGDILASIDRDDLDLQRLNRVCHQWELYEHTTPEITLRRIRDAHIVISNKVVLDRATLAGAPNLKLLCIAATGTNNVDLEAARELGVCVANVTRYATPSVVQHVFGLILALTTRLLDYREAVAGGAWRHSSEFCLLDFPIRELAGLTLGIVGYGELGQAVARVGEAFGMELLVAQRPGGPPQSGRLPLAQVLPRCDVLSLHCPLTPATRNLIGAPELQLMKDDALLINTARGGIVDEQALALALRAGRIGGAGVDVLEREPPRDGNPLLEADIPNLIVTPHIAWASREARQRVLDEVALNIEAFFEGRERNQMV